MTGASGASAGAMSGTSGASGKGGASGASAGSGATGAASGAASGASGATGNASGASSGSTAAPSYPLVTPPVRAAAPAAFGGAALMKSPVMAEHARVQLFASPPEGDAAAMMGGPSGLSAADVNSRFFTNGPTDIYQLLGAIDDRINGVNMGLQNSAHPCLSQTPVAYSITPFGETVTLYAQCFENVGSLSPDDPGFVQFGQKDGVTYYYSAVGAGWTAAILTPIVASAGADAGLADAGANGADSDAADPGTDASTETPEDAGTTTGSSGDANAPNTSGDANAANQGDATVPNAVNAPNVPVAYRVHAWSGVGYLNAMCGNMTGYDDCSYGVIELSADPTGHTFEMAVAGIGFGYCGAELKSDGTSVFGTGSTDMGTTCNTTATLCISASDLASPSTCDASLTTFSLPALGRLSSMGPNAAGPGNPRDSGAEWAPSAYPGGGANRITVDGTSSDSLHFGPIVPTMGTSSF
jgi:hypothetical protein